MAVLIRCTCGAAFQVKSVGNAAKLNCPTCQQVLVIPRAAAGTALLEFGPQDVKIECSCQQKIRLGRKLAGQSFPCPRCKKAIQVPSEPGGAGVRPTDLRPAAPSAVRSAPAESARLPDPEADGREASGEIIDLSSYEVIPETKGPVPSAAAAKAPAAGLELSLALPDAEPGPRKGPPVLGLSLAPPPTGPAPSSDPQETPAQCPGCSASWKPGAVLCIQCGYNLKAGTRIGSGGQTADGEEAEGEEEGLPADKLGEFFNTEGGIEAARAGITQMLNGFWLYLPMGLVSTVLWQATRLVDRKASPGAFLALSMLESLIGSFLFAGLVACVRDGLFQKDFGIERLLYYSVRYWINLVLGVVLTIPLWGIAFLGCLGIAYLFTLEGMGLATKVLLAALLGLLGVLWVSLVGLLLAAVSILEGDNPIRIFARAMAFGFKKAHQLLLMAVALLFIGGASFGTFFFIYRFGSMFAEFMPSWIYELFGQIMLSIISAGLLGEVVSSLMLLYLSEVKDVERLEKMLRRARGPKVRIPVLYATLAVLAATCVTLAVITPRDHYESGTDLDRENVDMLDRPEGKGIPGSEGAAGTPDVRGPGQTPAAGGDGEDGED